MRNSWAKSIFSLDFSVQSPYICDSIAQGNIDPVAQW